MSEKTKPTFGAYETPTSQENIDDRINDWHEGENVTEHIYDHLGMSWEQYASWVETTKFPCLHLNGYWIEEGVSFRCLDCGYQFQLSELPNIPRNIKPWTGN